MDDIPADSMTPDKPDSPGSSPESPQTADGGSQWLSGEKGNPLSAEQVSTADAGAQAPASPSGNPDIGQSYEVPTQSAAADPQSAMTTAPIVGPYTSSGGGSGFKIFVILGIFIIIAIWGAVGYLYYRNQNLKSSTDNSMSDSTVNVTPTPEFTPDQIKVKSGSIVREKPGGDVTVLIDKDKYESTGITGFLKVAVSPDNTKMCFESWAPAPEPALYLADIDGQNVTEASPNRQKCLWSKDSKSVFYINTASNTAPVNIYSYSLEDSTELNLTDDTIPSGVVRRYELVGLSADGSRLICKYEDAGSNLATNAVSECEIVLETGEVNPL
jgi:hypothetical protein